MTLEQVRAAAVVLLFLAAVVTAMRGTEIAAAAAGAWARGTAQAAAERRRLAAARERHAGGRGLSGAWGRAAATARGMRGAAQGASAWARQENGPVRRVAGAAATGAYLGARRAGRAAAAARRRARAGRAAGGTGPGRGSGNGGRGPRGARRPKPLGVCDQCGVTVARASLQPSAIDPRRLLCLICRTRRAETVPQPQPARIPLREPALAGAAALPRSAGDSGVITAGPAVPLPPADSGNGPLPAGATAVAAPATPLTPPAAPAARQIPAAEGAAAMTAGTPAAIGGGRPGTAAAVRPRAAAARPPGALALPAGGGTTHGEWERNVEAVAWSLARLFAHARRMTETMTAADGPENLIEDVSRWADHINAAGTRILRDFALIDAKLGPYIQAVIDAGGPAMVGSREWQADY